jgi:hypothetical protein
MQVARAEISRIWLASYELQRRVMTRNEEPHEYAAVRQLDIKPIAGERRGLSLITFQYLWRVVSKTVPDIYIVSIESC